MPDTIPDEEVGEVSDEDEAADLDNSSMEEKPKSKSKLKLAPELSDLVNVFKSVHFHGFEHAANNGKSAQHGLLGNFYSRMVFWEIWQLFLFQSVSQSDIFI